MSRYYDHEDDDREDDAPVSLGKAVPKRATDQALLVIREDLSELWVPKSCIHDDSECYSMRSGPGELKVLAWWARKQGLAC